MATPDKAADPARPTVPNANGVPAVNAPPGGAPASTTAAKSDGSSLVVTGLNLNGAFTSPAARIISPRALGRTAILRRPMGETGASRTIRQKRGL